MGLLYLYLIALKHPPPVGVRVVPDQPRPQCRRDEHI
jgi:hypothetical protein